MSENFKDIWTLRKPGARDSIRHKERIKQAIKDNLRHLIAEENIISSSGDKKVRVPIKYLDMWRFKFGKNTKASGRGVGQGDGKEGDVIAEEGEGRGSGHQAGQEAGEDIYEEEVSIEEVIDMMLEDLNLPFLERKENAEELETEETIFQDIADKGLPPNIDKKRSIYANMKKNASKGKVRIKSLEPSDLRYRVWENVIEKHSNASIFLLMDRSGSMDDEKKYIVKSFCWWMVKFIQKKYNNVEIVFIAHDTEAKVVEEQDFFSISQSGGTLCSSAFKLAKEIIEEKYPSNSWNNYVFEFSDGDNWMEDNDKCVELVKELLTMSQAVGYGEVKFGDWFYNWNKADKLKFDSSRLQSTFLKDKELVENEKFLTVSIRKKEDVYDCLKNLLSGLESKDTDEN